MAKKRYRANTKIEWPDYENTDKEGRPGTVVVNAGDEFSDPPEHADIDTLVKYKSATLLK